MITFSIFVEQTHCHELLRRLAAFIYEFLADESVTLSNILQVTDMVSRSEVAK